MTRARTPRPQPLSPSSPAGRRSTATPTQPQLCLVCCAQRQLRSRRYERGRARTGTACSRSSLRSVRGPSPLLRSRFSRSAPSLHDGCHALTPWLGHGSSHKLCPALATAAPPLGRPRSHPRPRTRRRPPVQHRQLVRLHRVARRHQLERGQDLHGCARLGGSGGLQEDRHGARGVERPSLCVVPLPLSCSCWTWLTFLRATGARRACSFDANGKGSCVTGDCPGGLECDDNTIGWVNVGEFNLNAWGGNDCTSTSPPCSPSSRRAGRAHAALLRSLGHFSRARCAVSPSLVVVADAARSLTAYELAGWTVPMSIEPDGCDSLSCTEDVLAACPDDRMKQCASSSLSPFPAHPLQVRANSYDEPPAGRTTTAT